MTTGTDKVTAVINSIKTGVVLSAIGIAFAIVYVFIFKDVLASQSEQALKLSLDPNYKKVPADVPKFLLDLGAALTTFIAAAVTGASAKKGDVTGEETTTTTGHLRAAVKAVGAAATSGQSTNATKAILGLIFTVAYVAFAATGFAIWMKDQAVAPEGLTTFVTGAGAALIPIGVAYFVPAKT